MILAPLGALSKKPPLQTKLSSGSMSQYGKRKAMEIATLGCAVRVKLSEDKKRIADVRLGYGVAGPTPMRCKKAEQVLIGSLTGDKEAIEKFLETALSELKPRDSWRASKAFRIQLIRELARRALEGAIERAGGNVND